MGDLRSYQKSAIGDPRVAVLTSVTRVIDDPAIEATAIEPGRVKVTLKDGRVLEVSSATMKGSPAEPMSEQETLAKFYDCMAFGLGASRAQADRLAEAIVNLERAENAAGALVGAFPSPP